MGRNSVLRPHVGQETTVYVTLDVDRGRVATCTANRACQNLLPAGSIHDVVNSLAGIIENNLNHQVEENIPRLKVTFKMSY